MECTLLEKFCENNTCNAAIVPEELQQHLAGCNDCKKYHRFVSALESRNGLLDKAPEELLPAIERRIQNSIRLKNREPWFIFQPRFKPAFAGFFAVLIVAASYTCLTHRSVGQVENLSKRFKIAQFENINSGDMLYAGDNTTASIRLKNDGRLQIHQNTIVKVDGARNLSLSRGEVSLQAGDRELRIATPGGMVFAKNTTAKIRSISRISNGVVATEISCMVFEGQLAIRSSSSETILHQGQKTVVAENGGITAPQQLTAAETASRTSFVAKHKLFAAMESLCDCITAHNYAPGKKTDHVQLFGRELNENKFKVRVFWQEKELNGLVFAPSSNRSEELKL